MMMMMINILPQYLKYKISIDFFLSDNGRNRTDDDERFVFF